MPSVAGGAGVVEELFEIGGAAQGESKDEAVAVVDGPVPASPRRSVTRTLVTIRWQSMRFRDRTVEHGPASAEEYVLPGYRKGPPRLDGDFADRW